MLPISTKDLVRFSPLADQIAAATTLRDDAAEDQREGFEKVIEELQAKAEAEPQPVYLIAVATGLQKAAFRRDVIALGARYPSDADLCEAIRKILRELDPANLDALLETVDQFEAAAGSADADLVERFRAIEETVEAMPDYARLRAERVHYRDVAPYVAARHFLVSVENSPVKVKRVGGLVPESVLDKLPEGHAAAIGWKALSLMTVSEKQRKN